MISNLKKWLPIPFLGLVAGFLNALLGAGGGIPLLLGLQALLGKRVADGRRFFTTTLAVMLPLSLLSVWQYQKKGALPTPPLFALLVPAVLGGALGALLLPRLSVGALRKIFATVVLFSGIFMVI